MNQPHDEQARIIRDAHLNAVVAIGGGQQSAPACVHIYGGYMIAWNSQGRPGIVPVLMLSPKDDADLKAELLEQVKVQLPEAEGWSNHHVDLTSLQHVGNGASPAAVRESIVAMLVGADEAAAMPRRDNTSQEWMEALAKIEGDELAVGFVVPVEIYAHLITNPDARRNTLARSLPVYYTTGQKAHCLAFYDFGLLMSYLRRDLAPEDWAASIERATEAGVMFDFAEVGGEAAALLPDPVPTLAFSETERRYSWTEFIRAVNRKMLAASLLRAKVPGEYAEDALRRGGYPLTEAGLEQASAAALLYGDLVPVFDAWRVAIAHAEDVPPGADFYVIFGRPVIPTIHAAN